MATKRSGKSCVVRLSGAEWSKECDRVCLLSEILSDMSDAYTADGNRMFPTETVHSIGKRMLEGCPGRVC